MSYSGLGSSSLPLYSAGPLGVLLQDGLLTLPSHISFPFSDSPSPPPHPILLLAGPVLKPLGVSPA